MVLGHRALCLPLELREPVLEAFSIAQTMIVASRGLRSYNIAELQLVYDRGYVDLFSAMERIYELNHDRLYDKRLQRHRKRPRKHAAPKRFRHMDRCDHMQDRLSSYDKLHVILCNYTHHPT